MKKTVQFILQHRVPILIIVFILLCLSTWQITKTNINSNVTEYFSDDTISKKTTNILSEEFSIKGDALVCVEGDANNFNSVEKVVNSIDALDGIDGVQWLGSYSELFKFKDGEPVSAIEIIPDDNIKELTNPLFVELDGKTYYIINIALSDTNIGDEASKTLDLIREAMDMEGFPYYLGGNAVQGNNMLDSAMDELPKFLITAIVVITTILLLTSKSIISALIFVITIGISCAFNMGTNLFTPNISVVTFSVAAILQLALSMDYSIFLTHAYEVAKETQDDETAMVTAIEKTFVVITASALTTIAGFCALFAMEFGLGFDLGLCLAKGVFFSFLTVIIVQPCLMFTFRKISEKTEHKQFIPKLNFLLVLPKKLKYSSIIIVGVLLIVSIFFASKLNYYFLDSQFDPDAIGAKDVVQSLGTQSAFVSEKITDEKQLELVRKIKNIDGVSSVTGYYAMLDTILSNISIPIYDSLTEQNEDTLLVRINLPVEQILLSMEGNKEGMEKVIQEQLTKAIEEIAKTTVSEKIKEKSRSLRRPLKVSEIKVIADGVEQEFTEKLEPVIYDQLSPLESDFSGFAGGLDSMKSRFFTDIDGTEHTFFTTVIKGESEGEEAIETVTAIHKAISETLGSTEMLSAGNTQAVIDFKATTNRDFFVVFLLTIVLILIIIAITFKSIKIAITLVVVIQLAILINLAICSIMGTSINFMTYIIISAIQLGATIDYAILLARNFKRQLTQYDTYDAILRALEYSAFSIIISVSILWGACLSVYFVSSDTIIREITLMISRGAFISGALVLLILPAILAVTTKKKIIKS